jgi:hypothetical protein
MLQEKVKRPLRKVIETFTDPVYGILRERLECGHVINTKSDCFGHYYAARRRCFKCAIEASKTTAS